MSDRIPTTHVGSLPRPKRVSDLLFAEERGDPLDPAAFEAAMSEAVDDVVRRQRAVGVDLASDGEMSKISYATYVRHRLTGFEGDSPRRVPGDLEDYPAWMARAARGGRTPTYRRPCCVGPVAVRDHGPLRADLARFRAALDRHPGEGAFMNAAGPGVIALFQPDRHHGTHEAYLDAVAEAMRPEYEAIAASGIALQIDAPDLALGRHMGFKDATEAEFLRTVALHVEVLNHALRNVDPSSVRLHVCWGNYEGPHHRDVPAARLMPAILKARARYLSFEGANPRHAHEWSVWRDLPLPDDKVIMPGVLDSTTNFVEHPLTVAERLCRYADVVGRERVIASSDCGFSTFAGYGTVQPEIAWAKLHAMSEGARVASDRLWGRPEREPDLTPPALPAYEDA